MRYGKSGFKFAIRVEAWFETEDAQSAQQNENKPPSITGVQYSSRTPRPGDVLDATVTGSDPENMEIAWEWNWKGNNVDQAGVGAGTTLPLGGLQIPESASPGDVYQLSLKATDPFGAFVTGLYPLDAVKPPSPPTNHTIQCPQSFGWFWWKHCGQCKRNRP